MFDSSRRLLLSEAMITHKEAAVPVDPQGCSAVVAVSHDGIIGEADSTDRQETSASGVHARDTNSVADTRPLLKHRTRAGATTRGEILLRTPLGN